MGNFSTMINGLSNFIHKSDAPDSLKMFYQDVGIPPTMHTDNAQELTQGEFAKLNRKMGTKQTSIEPQKPNQNRSELCMREFKKEDLATNGEKKCSPSPMVFCS